MKTLINEHDYADTYYNMIVDRLLATMQKSRAESQAYLETKKVFDRFSLQDSQQSI